MSPLKNHGLLIEPRIDPKDYRFGSVGLEYKEILNDGNWTPFLPLFEPQSNAYVDTQGCVPFSALNVVETILKQKTGQEYNASDRFTGVLAGVTKQGSYLSTVAEAIRLHKLLPEADLSSNLSTVKTWEEFWSPNPMTQDLLDKAQTFTWNIGWEWVGMNRLTIVNALKTSPLQVTVQIGSPLNSKGYYINREGSYGHAVMLYEATEEYFSIYDHYTNKFKKYDKSYRFGNAIRFALNEIIMPNNPLNLINDTLVTVIADIRQYPALYTQGKLYIDERDKIVDQWFARNEKDGYFRGGPKRTISEADLAGYAKYNLKNEKL